MTVLIHRRKAHKAASCVDYLRAKRFRQDNFRSRVSSIEAACSIFINADLIAEGLSPLRPEMGIPKAMRLMGEPLNECMAARQVFAIVSTLAGLQLLRTSPGTPGRR